MLLILISNNSINYINSESRKIVEEFVAVTSGMITQFVMSGTPTGDQLLASLQLLLLVPFQILDLFKIVDTEDEVVAVLDKFYKKYDLSPNF